MIEDMQRIQQLKVQGDELKAKDRVLLVQGSELVSFRQDIDELEKKAAGVRRKPDPRLLSQTDPLVIYLVKATKIERVPIEVWPHERVWKLHQIGCGLWDYGFDATYLAVGDVTLEDDQIVQEVMHPGEQAELRTWWLEDKEAAAESTKPVVK